MEILYVKVFKRIMFNQRPNLMNLNRVAEPPLTGSNNAMNRNTDNNFKLNQPC